MRIALLALTLAVAACAPPPPPAPAAYEIPKATIITTYIETQRPCLTQFPPPPQNAVAGAGIDEKAAAVVAELFARRAWDTTATELLTACKSE